MKMGKYLNEYTIAELEKEIERRKTDKHPMPKSLIDFGLVADHIVAVINCVADGGCFPKDWEQRVYESAIIAVYGNDIWDWLKEHTK